MITPNPTITRVEVIEEGVRAPNVLSRKQGGADLAFSTEPEVTNLEFFRACGQVVSVTNFIGGQKGQHLNIIGDAKTTILNNANIHTNTNAAKLLLQNVVYRFTYFDSQWYEDEGAVISSPGGIVPPHSHEWTDINNTPTTLAGYGITDAYTKAEVNSLFAPISHSHPASEVTTGIFGAGNFTFPAVLTVVTNLNVRGLNYTWPVAHGVAGNVLTNDGAGNLTWTPLPATGGVTSVTGTANRIFVNPNIGAVVVDISATYAGQASITTVGTITSGVWNGTAISSAYLGPHFHNAADINAGSFQNSAYTFPNNLTVSGTLFPTELVITKSVNNASGMALIQTTAATPTPRLFFQNTPDATGNAIYQTGGNLVFTTGATYLSASGTNRITLTQAGNVTFAGNISVTGTGSVGNSLTINAPAANVRDLIFASSAVSRWILRAESTAEGGANSGSNFQIVARDDAGAFLDTPFSITRALLGPITLARPTNVNAILTVTSGGITVNSGGVTITGSSSITGNWTVKASSAADIRLQETSQVLPLGLWGFVLSSDNLFIRKNTAAAGDFSTQTIMLRFSAAGNIIAGNWQASLIGVTFGGTGANLSTTGPGFLKQASLGANVTVSTLTSTDLPTHDIITLHTASGLTTGNYLRATSATTFAFAQIAYSEISGTPSSLPPSAHTHPASDITAGTFGAGDYVFPAQLTVVNTVSLQGNVTIGTNTAPFRALTFNAAAGNGRGFIFNSAGVNRWIIQVNNVAEGGADAGSNLDIQRYTDAGVFISTPFQLNRATGRLSINSGITLTGSLILVSTGPGFLKQTGAGSVVSVTALVSGDLPTHTHAASDITAGTFGVGNYVFPAALTITTTLTINGLTYTFPATHGVNGAVLTNNSSGVLTWTLPGSAPVTSVTGTANRITVSPTTGVVVVDIAATYVGQASITTVGTITVGTWNGTVIASAFIGAHGLVSATHTVSGLTTGNYLRANSATTYGFAQVQYSELGGVPATFPPAAHTHPASEITAGTFGAGNYAFPAYVTFGSGVIVPGTLANTVAFGGFLVTDVGLRKNASGVLAVVLGDLSAYGDIQFRNATVVSTVIANSDRAYTATGTGNLWRWGANATSWLLTEVGIDTPITITTGLTGTITFTRPLISNNYIQVPGTVAPAIYFGGGGPTNPALRKNATGELGVVLGDTSAYADLAARKGTFNGDLVTAGFLTVSAGASITADVSDRVMALVAGTNPYIAFYAPTSATRIGYLQLGPGVGGLLLRSETGITALQGLTRVVIYNSNFDIGALQYTWPGTHVTNGFLKNDGSGNLTWVTVASSVTGTGTTNTIPLWSSSTALADSILQQSSANVLQITTSSSPAALRFFDSLGYIELSKTTTGTFVITNSLTTVTAAMLFSSVTPQFVFRASVTNVSDLGTSSLRWRNVYGTAALVSVVELFDPLGITSLGKITASPFSKLQWDDGVIVKTIAAVVPIAAPADPVDLPSALAVIISLKTHLQNAGVFL